jgi:hypothetical protein
MLIGEKERGAGVVTSVPRRQRQLLVLVRVVNGGVEVHNNRVAARDFGGNVDGQHGEHGVAAGSKVRGMRKGVCALQRAHLTEQTGTLARPPRP